MMKQERRGGFASAVHSGWWSSWSITSGTKRTTPVQPVIYKRVKYWRKKVLLYTYGEGQVRRSNEGELWRKQGRLAKLKHLLVKMQCFGHSMPDDGPNVGNVRCTLINKRFVNEDEECLPLSSSMCKMSPGLQTFCSWTTRGSRVILHL